ncbi:hypothetical protein J6590_097460 [Homalodisca vitripennis]|nr:hypothetical protein J6590_097460 [Homalodisca vitripennis]
MFLDSSKKRLESSVSSKQGDASAQIANRTSKNLLHAIESGKVSLGDGMSAYHARDLGDADPSKFHLLLLMTTENEAHYFVVALNYTFFLVGC